MHAKISAVKGHDAVLVKDLLRELLAAAVRVPCVLLGLVHAKGHRRKEHELGVLTLIKVASGESRVVLGTFDHIKQRECRLVLGRVVDAHLDTAVAHLFHELFKFLWSIAQYGYVALVGGGELDLIFFRSLRAKHHRRAQSQR